MPEVHTPIRPITSGPGYHWFGYYDKLQFDATGRYALGMEVDFESRSPEPDDEIALGIIDLKENDTWREIGATKSWCWQQGCMLQWLPESRREVIWNERDGDRFVARIYDTGSDESRTLSEAIYSVSPDGQSAIGTDFRRINHMRPGYGYAGIPDPNVDVLAPKDAGIYTVDLRSGESGQIISIAEAAALPYPHADLNKARHYFNHLLFNTDGSRFIFLHRWRFGDNGFNTRMMTAAADGSNLHVVDDYGQMSHFIWRDPQTILAWSWQPSHESAFYQYRDQTDEVEVIGEADMTLNGHCSYLSNSDWILNDCYPRDGNRAQDLYLYHVPTSRRIDIGSFHSPEAYTGEWRCDLHPRSDRTGTQVTIDSAHLGGGRQMYLLDISEALKTI